ncbi:VWA domain-containing protein [Thiomicrorhabdus arctica]|uniref:VWA domain-containing protein n=1 Tax=Thiomicrorhabdus arctica TaxID=131540 RepID=UPI0003777DCF|nr:VWA domain-containing protein [Thiomicrorhabdus arctica]
MDILTLLANLTEIEFLSAWMLVFLPLPWIIRRFSKPVAQQQNPLLAPQIMARISENMPQNKLVAAHPQKARIPLLFILLWGLLILAAMRPIWYLNPTPFEVSGKELMLAVDLSGSMRKEDMYLNGHDVNRLVAVKSVVSSFIEQRKGDRIGLIVFGTQAFLQSPLTYDLHTVKTLLNETEIGMAGNNTAIGDAIGLTLKHLEKTQKNQHSKAVLILLTDGSNTAGQVDPIKAAEKAKQLGLKIYTVGVGRVQDRNGLDIFLAGKSEMDITSLKRISKITHGQFFQANDTQQLSKIYQYINQLESSDHEVNNYRHRSELYVWPLGAAFILSLGLALLHLKRRGQ